MKCNFGRFLIPSPSPVSYLYHQNHLCTAQPDKKFKKDTSQPSTNNNVLNDLLTSIFALADSANWGRIMKTFKRWILPDCVKSFLGDSTQSADIYLLKVFIFLYNFAKSASAKINVNKSFKICLLDD